MHLSSVKLCHASLQRSDWLLNIFFFNQSENSKWLDFDPLHHLIVILVTNFRPASEIERLRRLAVTDVVDPGTDAGIIRILHFWDFAFPPLIVLRAEIIFVQLLVVVVVVHLRVVVAVATAEAVVVVFNVVVVVVVVVVGVVWRVRDDVMTFCRRLIPVSSTPKINIFRFLHFWEEASNVPFVNSQNILLLQSTEFIKHFISKKFMKN